MKMYNYEIEHFVKFLMSLELPSKDSRMRGRFKKLADERIQQMEYERMQLIQEFAHLNEYGEPEVVDDEYSIRDKEGFVREYNTMRTEWFFVEPTADKQDMINSIRDSVLNTNLTFKGEEALLYDRFCEIVEEE